jgi:DNA-binding transcriptional MerR regulator
VTTTLRIGQAAAAAGVSTRTLRYYEQVGLLRPAAYSSGGERRYTDVDVERLRRIRDLQRLLGSDLADIRTVLEAEDRLADIRAEFRSGISARRKRELLDEATAINERMQEQVRQRIGALEGLLAELQARRARHDALRDELGARAPAQR